MVKKQCDGVNSSTLKELEQGIVEAQEISLVIASNVLEHLMCLTDVNFGTLEKRVIVIIGKTQTGKTSLLLYLAGAKIHADNMLKLVFDGNVCANIPRPDQTPFSDTTNPATCVINGTQNIDFPGFFDNRGIVHELVNIILINRVMSLVDEVKLLFVITEEMLTKTALDGLLNSVEAISYYVDPATSGTLIVITKKNSVGKADDDLNFVLGKINDILKSDISLTNDQRHFFEFVTQTKNFKYAFPRPSAGEPVSTKERYEILDYILNNQTYVSVKSQPMPKITAKRSQALITMLGEAIYKYIQEESESLTKVIPEDVGAYKATSKDIDELQETIASMSVSLRTLLNNRQANMETFFTKFKDLLKIMSPNGAKVAAKILEAINLLKVLKNVALNTGLTMGGFDVNKFLQQNLVQNFGIINEYLTYSSDWYKLLLKMREVLSAPSVQLYKGSENYKFLPDFYNKVNKLPINASSIESETSVFLNNFGQHFIQPTDKCMSIIGVYAGGLESISKDESESEDLRLAARVILQESPVRIKELLYLLELTFISEPVLEMKDGVVTFSGEFLTFTQLKEKIKQYKPDDIKEIRIFALVKVFLDADLDTEHFKGKNVVMFASDWQSEITPARKIILDGRPGKPGKILKLCTAAQCDVELPGSPGESSGYFFGILQTLYGIQKLSISTNGGIGGMYAGKGGFKGSSIIIPVGNSTYSENITRILPRYGTDAAPKGETHTVTELIKDPKGQLPISNCVVRDYENFLTKHLDENPLRQNGLTEFLRLYKCNVRINDKQIVCDIETKEQTRTYTDTIKCIATDIKAANDGLPQQKSIIEEKYNALIDYLSHLHTQLGEVKVVCGVTTKCSNVCAQGKNAVCKDLVRVDEEILLYNNSLSNYHRHKCLKHMFLMYWQC